MTRNKIDTERLLLRRWQEKDHAPFAAMCNDPEVMRYIGDGSKRTAEHCSRAIASFETEWDEKGYGLFAVESKRTGEMIGFTGLSWPDFLPEVLPSVEIGWRFSRANWGKGYASEAAVAALSYGTDEVGLSDIVSICQVGNDASVRIMRKLGLIFDRQTTDPSCGRAVSVYRFPRS